DTPCCVGNSSDNAICCFCCDRFVRHRAGYGPTTAATTIPIVRSAEQRFRQCATAGQADCFTFAQCRSERSGHPCKLSIFHSYPATASVTKEWPATLH